MGILDVKKWKKTSSAKQVKSGCDVNCLYKCHDNFGYRTDMHFFNPLEFRKFNDLR